MENQTKPWTRFYDMHSGGGCKLDFSTLYVEAPKHVAIEAFKRLFDRDPYNVTCDCCGRDYYVEARDEPFSSWDHAPIRIIYASELEEGK